MVYEAGVAVAGFAAGVTGDLAARWRERLVDRLDWALRSRVSGLTGGIAVWFVPACVSWT
jgi:hypothetical protein